MRRLAPRVRIAVAVLILCAAVAHAQWVPVIIPTEFNYPQSFLADDGIYCGSATGNVFVSHDHGDTWTEIAGGGVSALRAAPVRAG